VFLLKQIFDYDDKSKTDYCGVVSSVC